MSFLQVQRNKGGKGGRELVYVHLASSVWSKTKRRPVQRRVYLGRLEPASGEVVISKGFPGRGGSRVGLVELGDRVKNGDDLVAWLRMPQQEMRCGGATADPPARVDVIGDVHVLLALARETGLEEALVQAYAEDAPALLALAFHQAAEGRALYLAEDWLGERELPATMKGSAVSTDNAYGLIVRAGTNRDARERFFRQWFHRHKGAHAVICDTTSISTYATDLELAEFGHNRDGEKLPQINLCLVADRASRMPLWCRPLPGSIPDVSSLAVTAELLQDLGLERFTVSLDRGFYSRANLRDLVNSELDFVIGAPYSVKQARELVGKHRSSLASPKRSFPFAGRVMRHVSDTWSLDMGNGQTRSLQAHLFLEPSRRAERIHRLETTVFALEDKAGREQFVRRFEAVAWLNENAGWLAKCFAIAGSAEVSFTVRRKPRAVALAASRMGYTLILSSRLELSAEEALTDYRSKDQVEKLFDCLKNDLHQNRLRTGWDESVEGRLLLAFIALVLRSALEDRMRKADLLRKMTVAEVLAQLRKIKAVTTQRGKRVLLEISKRNRDLLSRLGAPPPR